VGKLRLETERIILRELTLDDKHSLFKLFSEKFVSTYEAHLPTKNISNVIRAIQEVKMS